MKKALSLFLLCVLLCTLFLSVLTSCSGTRIVFDYQDKRPPSSLSPTPLLCLLPHLCATATIS